MYNRCNTVETIVEVDEYGCAVSTKFVTRDENGNIISIT